MTLKQPPPLSLRLSPELEQRLRDEADSLGLGLSEVLRRRIVSGSTGEPEHREVWSTFRYREPTRSDH